MHSSELHEKRTDELFTARTYVNHQIGETPLVLYRIPCISSFVLDYMHCVCLGVVKRILWLLKQGQTVCKLSHVQLGELSNKLVSYSGKLPSEFARQPRSLAELERWKATEFMQFLLYTGPIVFVLRKILSKERYIHFLTLAIGISILLESDSHKRASYLDYASSLLSFFCK